jgi:hypothetical protein
VPELPDVPELPELPELPVPAPQPAEPLLPVPAPVPDMPPLPPLLVEVPLSMPLLSSPPPMDLHADKPKASVNKPARSTLWCFSFMINSY